MDNEKYIGEGKLVGDIKKKLLFILNEDSIDTKHVKNGSITAEKLSEGIIDGLSEFVSEKVLDILVERIVANKFGNAENISISQKLLTDTINDIYAKLRDMAGEPPVGLYLTATPEYYIGEEGADVNIEAISTSGVFEHIAFYVDDELLAESEYVYRFQANTHIDNDAVIRCDATIMGIDYTTEKTVRRYNSFWLGAGTTYEDVMNLEHIIPVESETLRGAYDVTCDEGNRFFIILGSAFKESYIRADLNGFEIPFTMTKITKDGNDYWVYASENQYHAGTYNIDING